MNVLFDQRRYLIPFRATLLPQIFTDVLVIGAGVAGMRAALAAAEGDGGGRDVIITAKGRLDQSNTYWAQGGISAVMDAAETGGGDSIESHIHDTLTAGAGLCDEPIVRAVVEAAPRRITELIDWGMRFDRAGASSSRGPKPQGGDLAFGREGGHSFARVLHANGDATGRELAVTLERQVRQNERIRVFDDCFVLDLITADGSSPGNGQCVGAITHHPKYGLQMIWAAATILTSGGAGQVYRESTNPAGATGDGLAIAYRAGAVVADMAFMQFHPTTLYVAGASRSLITEAVRGEGALLIDRNGHRFMPDYHELAELAPRDVVSRAMLEQMANTGFTNVYLDCRPIAERFGERFPGINELLRKFNINPATDPIPVHPSAHYMIGGVRTDACGRTNVRGLYAAGEVASTGLHGANRLASNSLVEGLVFGQIVGRTCWEMLEVAGSAERRPLKVVSDIQTSERAELDLADVRSSLRSVMWRHVGIERTGDRLSEVQEMFDFWARYTLDKIFDDRSGWEVQNMLLAGALMNRAARWRTESRGVHFRRDYPDLCEAMRVHDLWVRGAAEPTLVPVRKTDSAVTSSCQT